MTATRAAPPHGYVALPDGWERVSAGGPGPFVTHELLRRPDGTLVRWRSRAHRKSAQHATRWMSGLFALGSTCFLAASVASQWASSSRPAIGVTFFAGSVCFLVASALAYAEVCHRWWCMRRRSLSWWIVALNLLGSAAFGVAAIASLVDPSTDAMLNVRLVNAGTSIGAACFLAGALLLPREAAAARESPVSGEAR
jgi:hypothetical protein